MSSAAVMIGALSVKIIMYLVYKHDENVFFGADENSDISRTDNSQLINQSITISRGESI